MKKYRVFLRDQRWLISMFLLAIAVLCWLFLYRLGSLSGGLSMVEHQTAITTYGWHGLYNHSFYLPLNVVRSIIFKLAGHHGQTLTRLPNALFGALTILIFCYLLWLWHGARTAIFGTILFASSAWTLHISRLASNDIMYLWAVPALLLSNLILHKHGTQALIFYLTLFFWGVLLFIPGLVWLVLLTVIWQRRDLAQSWQHFKLWWQRVLIVIVSVIWLPLLIHTLLKTGNLRNWLGLPNHFADPQTLLRQFVAVPVHIFIRGPEYPQLWLGKAPILDVFTLIMTVLGIYFYASHYQANRSRLLGCCFILGWLLVALGGPVGLSLLIPLMYLCAATGIAYLIHEWLRVFPTNPLARSLGLGLVIVAISLSTLYNVRAYFVAWPNNPTTQATFRYRE